MVGLAEKLKDKLTASYDDIPESLVKQRIQLIKGTLTHIYNVTLSTALFWDERKSPVSEAFV